MKYSRKVANVLRFAAIIALVGVPVAFSSTIYKSMDEEGHIRYSDMPPESAGQVIEVLKINPPKTVDSDASSERLQQIRQAADNLQSARLAREEIRQRERELALRQEEIRAPDYVVIEEHHYRSPRIFPRDYRRFRHFPDIHRQPHGRQDTDVSALRDAPFSSGPLLRPASRLLTP